MAIKIVPARPVTGNNITTEFGKWVHDLLNNQFDVSANAGRKEFIDNAINNEHYILYDNNDVYDVWTTNVQTGTQINFTGWRLWTDGTGTKAREFVIGIVTENTIQPIQATIYAGKYKMFNAELPANVEPTELISKATAEQMILDNNAVIATDATDPTWRDLSGTQSTQFNASQIVIDLTNSGLAVGDNIQLLLGSTGWNVVLAGAVNIYDDVTEAARNGTVAGQYKWYAYKFSDTIIKFVMEDSKGALTNQSQTIAKVRNVSPNLQKFTGHYTSQAAVLKGAVNITGINKGASQEITLPAGITTDNLTGISLTVSGSTDWYEVDGWDKVTAFYISVSNEAAGQIWWVEYKIEAVTGDKTKLKVTNFKSGNLGTENEAYNAHWIAFKGGK